MVEYDYHLCFYTLCNRINYEELFLLILMVNFITFSLKRNNTILLLTVLFASFTSFILCYNISTIDFSFTIYTYYYITAITFFMKSLRTSQTMYKCFLVLSLFLTVVASVLNELC